MHKKGYCFGLKINLYLFCNQHSLLYLYIIIYYNYNMKTKLLLLLTMVMSLSSMTYSYGITTEDYTPITTNLPTIFINTENGVEITSKEEYVNAVVTVRGAANDEDNITEVAAEIKGRGNSTWGMAKKPYRLKFEEKIKFLGNEAKEKNWVLLANYADKTLMRNALAFETARNMFHFQFVPSVTFVDVVLNGENIGSYMLTDQVEVKSKRVNIAEQGTDVYASDPEITGGYLIEVDGFAASEISWFMTNKSMAITIKYPKNDEINEAQKNYIRNYTQRMENALFSKNFTDEERGWRRYVDETSWVEWYIACELFGNSDSWWSTYMYKDRDEKFKFGPLWDFDIAFNNDYRIGDATKKYMRESGCEPTTWIKQWWLDENLTEAVKVRWRELMDNGLQDFMNNCIDQTALLLDESQKNNYEIWKTLSTRVHFERQILHTYEAEVESLKKYVNARIEFLDSAWGEEAGVDGIERDEERVLITPNPIAQGSDIEIELNSIDEGNVIDVYITALDGKTVYTSQSIVGENNKVSVTCSRLVAGVYIITIGNGGHNMYRAKLVVR